MAKFCIKCGSRLDETTGLCPNCDAKELNKRAKGGKNTESGYDSDSKTTPGKRELKKQKKEEKKAQKKALKKAKRANRSLGKRIRKFLLKFVLTIFLLSAITLGCVGTLVYFDILDIPIIENILIATGLKKTALEDSVSLENYKVEASDSEDFFQQNSQIISEIDVNDSKDVPTEAEVTSVFENRGFTDFPITTEYDMDGVYSDASVISSSSPQKHPLYQTNYISTNGELWTVSVIDGDIIAVPVSYNMQSSLGIELVVSESKEITSYDSSKNKFYKTVPDESALIVRIADKIDAETLDKLTIGELEK